MNPHVPPIEAVVFDIGEVLVKLDFSPVLVALKLPPSLPLYEALEQLEGWHIFDSFERGKITKEGFLDELSTRSGLELVWDTFLPVWNSVIVSPFPFIDQQLKALSQQVPIFALTNSNECHIKFLRETFHWMNYFVRVFSSHLIGARKPDPEVFRYVTGAIEYSPLKTLFIDDRVENVEAASRAGFIAELCNHTQFNLLQILRKYHLVHHQV